MKNNKTNLNTTKILFAVTAIIAVVMIGKGISVAPIIDANSKSAEKLSEDIAKEQSRIEEIESISSMVGTDEFIEKIAREKLGMIKANEIVFIDISGTN